VPYSSSLFGDVSRRSSTVSHSVWGRLVPCIPAFCREPMVALPEDSSIPELTSRAP
jgi:hypothetical protein